jgi:hypothetical protein
VAQIPLKNSVHWTLHSLDRHSTLDVRATSAFGVVLAKFREGIFLQKLTRKGADKFLGFLIFLFAAQPKEFFLDGLKKLEQRSHKCGAQRGICRVNTFFQSRSLLFS